MQDCHQEGVTDDRKFDSPKRGVKGKCDSCQEVHHLTGVTVIREV